MLSRKHRLSRLDVKNTLKQGRIFRAPSCTVRYLPSPLFRIGVAVSKKIARTAVARNRIRRFVYTKAQNYTKTPVSLVCTVHTADSGHLSKDIEDAFAHLTK